MQRIALGLQPHPEGGWYRRTWTSPLIIETARGPRPSGTAILYLLDAAQRPVSGPSRRAAPPAGGC